MDTIESLFVDALSNTPSYAEYVDYGALKALMCVTKAIPAPTNDVDTFGVIMVCEAVTAALDTFPFSAAGAEVRALLAEQIDQMRSIVAAGIGMRRGDTVVMSKELLARSEEILRALRQLQQRLFPIAFQ